MVEMFYYQFKNIQHKGLHYTVLDGCCELVTYQYFAGTSALPPHMDMYNFTREDSNGGDSSYPATPSNGRRHGRESSPSSSSTSVSQDEGFCPISPVSFSLYVTLDL